MEIASITSDLTPLVFLACPVGMGAMMWMMMRGNRSRRDDHPTPSKLPTGPSQSPSLEVLREEQRRLADEIERLEVGRETPAAHPDRRS